MAVDYEKLIPTPGHPIEQDLIKEVLPHRDPFLWVTRIIEFEPGERIVGELYVDPELPLFKGHYPQHPVFPGVIQMEALAQTSGFAMLADPANQGKIGFLGSMDKVKLRRQVLPGETLRLECELIKANARSARFAVKATVDGEVASEAIQFYVIAPGETLK